MSKAGTAAGQSHLPKMTIPAVPRLSNNTSISAMRTVSASSPMRPSPLRETSFADAIEELSLDDTPNNSPEVQSKPNKGLARTKTNITPPDSIKGTGLVIVNSGRPRTMDSETSQTAAGTGFVQHDNIDDPFTSSPTPQQSTPQPAPMTANTGREVNSTIARIQSNIAAPAGNGFSPRPDRIGEAITAQNAQGLCPPEALLFIANLSNQLADDQLDVSVHEAFDVYGSCHVKIRRDKNQQPYGFIQYEVIEDAEMALREARRVQINGRTCRTERAKAARAVVLARISGGQISEDEARGVMEPFGAIAAVYPVTIKDVQELGMPLGGTWIKFAFFQDCRDAIWGFRHNELYRLLVPPSEESQRPLHDSASSSGFPRRSGSDGRSIFVGGLPEEVYEDQIRQIFVAFGTIDQLTIIRKPVPGRGLNTFAFIEFRHEEEAQAATQVEVMMGMLQLRVEPKEYAARRHARFVAGRESPQPNTTPQPNPQQQQTILHSLYHQALQMGLPQYQAANILNAGQVAAVPAPHFGPQFTNTQPAMPTYGSHPYTPIFSTPNSAQRIMTTPGGPFVQSSGPATPVFYQPPGANYMSPYIAQSPAYGMGHRLTMANIGEEAFEGPRGGN